MRIKYLLTLLVSLTLLSVAQAGAPMGVSDLYAMSQHVVLVRVAAVDKETGTVASPPVVHLQVVRSLRGLLKAGNQLDLQWSSDSQAGFYALREGGEAGRQRWLETPIAAPLPDSEYYLLLRLAPPNGPVGSFTWQDEPRCRLLNSPENTLKLNGWLEKKL